MTSRSDWLASRWPVISLLLIHGVLVSIPALRYGPRIDEVGHLAAGLSHWQTADFGYYAVNPPFVRLIATAPVFAAGRRLDLPDPLPRPARRPEFQAGSEFAEKYGLSSLNAGGPLDSS